VGVWYWLGDGGYFNRCTQTGASVANNGWEKKEQKKATLMEKVVIFALLNID